MARDLPPLRLLTAFAAVARNGSVQAAAAELNVTQPAISQAVRQLESHIGLRLLDRAHKPARPTAAGQSLAAAITEGLQRIADTVAELQRTEVSGAETVTVACSVGVATYWLMPRLARFYEAHPEATVNVLTSQQGAPDLSGGVDVAIRFGHGRWTDGRVDPLFAEVVEPQCAPGLRNRFDGPVDLAATTLIHVRSPEVSWVTWSDYLRRTGQPPVRGRERSFTNYVQATQAALEGQGVILGWRSITGDLVASGGLVPAGLPRHVPPDGFFLVSGGKRGRPAVEAFVAWARTAGAHSARTATAVA